MLQTNTLMEEGDEKEPGEEGKGFILSVALVDQIPVHRAFKMHLGLPDGLLESTPWMMQY